MQITNYNSFVCGYWSLCCFVVPLMYGVFFAFQESTCPYVMSVEFMHSFVIFCASAPVYTHMLCVTMAEMVNLSFLLVRVSCSHRFFMCAW